jgi:hypothetical protein
MASMPPLSSDLRMCGDTSLRAIGPPQPPLGDPRHLQLPAKHDRHSFCVSEGITNPKTRLARVVVGTHHKDAKARAQHMCFWFRVGLANEAHRGFILV